MGGNKGKQTLADFVYSTYCTNKTLFNKTDIISPTNIFIKLKHPVMKLILEKNLVNLENFIYLLILPGAVILVISFGYMMDKRACFDWSYRNRLNRTGFLRIGQGLNTGKHPALCLSLLSKC